MQAGLDSADVRDQTGRGRPETVTIVDATLAGTRTTIATMPLTVGIHAPTA
jgi:hypothetical protein